MWGTQLVPLKKKKKKKRRRRRSSSSNQSPSSFSSLMLLFLITILTFFFLFSNSFPLYPLPSWASEVKRVFVLFWQQLLYFLAHFENYFRKVGSLIIPLSLEMAFKRKCTSKVENVEDSQAISVLDLPDLALECILGRLKPVELCRMAGVCGSLRERCRSDYLWERHMREKWGRVVGRMARREWEWYLTMRKEEGPGNARAEGGRGRKRKRWSIGSLASVWPLSWLKSRLDICNRQSCGVLLPLDESILSWYLALESGKFWFPAQVYNREHGHVGFMLSCYDAELSYDCRTDTFQARYPPHGRRTVVIEEGVQWERIRAPPVDTPAHYLHVSDCLHDLHPGNHIEIQWRRNKEFPYGWWYGIVGHLESCDGSEHFCRCHKSDIVVLEFNQYTPGSRWRRTTISRKDHREQGNEADGFYGGIRKLYTMDEISIWKQLWPVEVLE